MSTDNVEPDDPTPAYGYAAPAAESSDGVLRSHPGDDGDPPRKSPKRWLVVGGAALLAVALVGGISFAVRGLSGAGTQPEDVLPSGAFAFAKVDLDPSAGQKVDAIRFMRKFPELRKRVADDADLRRVLFDSVAEVNNWSASDYERHVEPWLGQRVGVAIYPGSKKGDDGGDVAAIAAVQATDEDAARKGLDRLIAKIDSDEKPSYSMVENYVLLTSSTDAARVDDSGDEASLAQDKNFAADVGALDDGIAAAWMDIGGFTRQMGAARLFGQFFAGGLQALTGGASGRATYVLRFDGPDVLELQGKTEGSDVTVKDPHALNGFAELPGESLLALGIADGDKIVPQVFESFRKTMADAGGDESLDEAVKAIEEQYDIKLPADIAVLFGSNLLVSVDDFSMQDQTIEVGARITTDRTRAMQLFDKVEAAMADAGVDAPTVHRKVDDGLIVASSEQEAARMAAKGDLGSSETFGKALPDVEGANGAVWVDLSAIVQRVYAESEGSLNENLEPLRALGASGEAGGEGSGSFRVRLVVR